MEKGTYPTPTWISAELKHREKMKHVLKQIHGSESYRFEQILHREEHKQRMQPVLANIHQQKKKSVAWADRFLGSSAHKPLPRARGPSVMWTG